MPLRDDAGEVEANIFYMAYVADRPAGAEKRPLTFSFNGGPGSSSVWLHLGAIGPRRVRMLEEGGMPAPPYELVDNEATWLDLTDLVFIDPGGHRLQPAQEAGAGTEVLGRRRRHPVGGRVHPPLPDAPRALGLAAVPGRRELRHDARGRIVRAPRGPRHRAERDHARVVHPELPDRALHPRQRHAVSLVPPDLHRDGVVPPPAARGPPAEAAAPGPGRGRALGRRGLSGRAGQGGWPDRRRADGGHRSSRRGTRV